MKTFSDLVVGDCFKFADPRSDYIFIKVDAGAFQLFGKHTGPSWVCPLRVPVVVI